MSDRPLRNTRRTFLASSALEALSAATTGATAAATDETVAPTATVDCSTVSVDDWGSARSARAVFEDGSFVDVGDGTPETFGASGRVIESVTFADFDGTEWTTTNDATDCDPGEKSVTFTDSRATVRPGQFQEMDGYPGKLISQVDLHFVDGTSQEKVHLDGPQSPDGITGVYRGTGEYAGKVVEAIEIFHDLDYVTHYVRNPAAEQYLLGKDTCQERLIEVMGATEGAVDYEFTVEGPVRAVTLSDGRGASPGGNDAVSTSGDATTVSGSTGNPGYSDVYAVGGPITDFAQTGGDGDYVRREAEWRVVEDTAPATDLLAVVATEQGEVAYEFTVDGTVRPIGNVGPKRSAAGNDEVTDNGDATVTVSGFTGNAGYGDTYAVTGDVTDFTRTGGDAAVRIDYNGHERTPEELVSRH
ncbi:hypothetical protein C475_04061 [Halosimplex carlsbadense 2-9-1]|uniref:Uncharacterized protein n=1 Tax=Halosimplex carlsbadense 2-9-1 TaxID=797114 RepID=M0CZZ0_9EURY|nr:hypothetical protein [Halosimplex carlsbadense]ELZ28780.1 hypothetical protein C475_04061 [Halosimplex carlsbadense 2-9-1]